MAKQCLTHLPEAAGGTVELGDSHTSLVSFVLSSLEFDKVPVPAHHGGRSLIILEREVEIDVEL